ncbi:hypothetical protein CJ030_MR5G003517 [Morella rubra]|uniref:Uncharacterized protein n=1 Tax=Morella rubra TaxID=262757 RepID=A0A6A1VRS7_9ROSI|nr:hypothetical protein CJ030_MR5G003520 [Morella rubra]KAB1213413.1 hypothetical protein CJ030_MR5G003517 [Morella rubra]
MFGLLRPTNPQVWTLRAQRRPIKLPCSIRTSSEKKGVGLVAVDQNVALPFAQQGQWMQYAQQQYQHPQQSMMGVYLPGQPIPQPLHMGTGAGGGFIFGESGGIGFTFDGNLV